MQKGMKNKTKQNETQYMLYIHVPSLPPASHPKSNHYPKFVVYHCMLSRLLLHTNCFASFETLFTSVSDVNRNRYNRKHKMKAA